MESLAAYGSDGRDTKDGGRALGACLPNCFHANRPAVHVFVSLFRRTVIAISDAACSVTTMRRTLDEREWCVQKMDCIAPEVPVSGVLDPHFS